MKIRIAITLFSIHMTFCRDFYVGMFKKDDLLVASDTLYKERSPYRLTTAMYGRLFKCDITYFRVVDRLGVGRVPRVEITRGGLRKKYVVLRITSGYNLPLSVNVYVGCENKHNFTRSTRLIRPSTLKVTTETPLQETTKANDKGKGDGDDENTKDDDEEKEDEEKKEEDEEKKEEGEEKKEEQNEGTEEPKKDENEEKKDGEKKEGEEGKETTVAA